MTVAEAIAQLPGETRVSVTIGGSGPTIDELRLALMDRSHLTTTEAAKRYPWGRAYWAERAKEMDGAIFDGQWHLPVEAIEAHVAAKREASAARLDRKRDARPTTPSTTRTRPTGLQKR